MVRALDRRALDHVRVHGGERRVVVLACANPNHALDRLDEDLPVAHFAGAGGRQDRFDAWLDERLGAHHLDLDLLVKLHDDRGTAVLAHDLLLAPVTAHATQCDPGDAGLEQRRLDFGQAFGPNDSGDEFHNGEASPSSDTVSTESCIKCSKLVSGSNWLRTAYYMPLSPVCKSCREMDSPPSYRVSPVGGEARVAAGSKRRRSARTEGTVGCPVAATLPRRVDAGRDGHGRRVCAEPSPAKEAHAFDGASHRPG